MCSVERLLDSQHELVAQIRHTLGLEEAEFERLILPVLKRYAAFVHLLPASERNHHRGAGGLLHHGMEVSFCAARESEGVLFVAGGTPLERKELEPRWHVAVWLAGLLHDLGKPVSDITITDQAGLVVWDPYSETLFDWATRNKLDRYFLHWHPERHRRHESFALHVAVNVITPELKFWLTHPHAEIFQSVNITLNNPGTEIPVAQIVKRADEYSASTDLKESRHDQTNEWGIPIEKFLLDAMLRLIDRGEWKVNERGARVWVTKEELFVVWKQGAKEIIDMLLHDQVKGIPQDPRTLAEILLERGYALPYVGGNGMRYPYWRVAPDLLRAQDGSPVVLEMLRLAGTSLLFNAEPPTRVSVSIIEENKPVGPAGQSWPDPHPATETRGAPAHSKTMTEVAPAPGSAAGGTNTPPEDDKQKTIHIGVPEKGTRPPTPVPRPTQPEIKSAAPEPPAADCFTSYGEAGRMVMAMAQDVQSGKRKWDQALSRVGDTIVVRYPEGAALYGDASAILNCLSEAGWIDVDPLRPNRKVRELGGARGLVLTPEVSARALAVAQGAKDTPAHKPTPVKSDTQQSVAAPAAAAISVGAQRAARELLEIIRTGDPDMPYRVSSNETSRAVSVNAAEWYAERCGTKVSGREILLALGTMPGVRVGESAITLTGAVKSVLSPNASNAGPGR